MLRVSQIGVGNLNFWVCSLLLRRPTLRPPCASESLGVPLQHFQSPNASHSWPHADVLFLSQHNEKSNWNNSAAINQLGYASMPARLAVTVKFLLDVVKHVQSAIASCGVQHRQTAVSHFEFVLSEKVQRRNSFRSS